MATESIIVSHIPEETSRSDLVQHFTDTEYGGSRIHYLLYPLGADHTKALIAFFQAKAVQSILKHRHRINGVSLKVQPAPRQAYQKCTADVEPMLLATIDNADECLRQLEKDFGVEILRDTEHSLNVKIEGSFLQIQAAQAVLDEEYNNALVVQHQELLRVGAVSTNHRNARHGALLPARSRSPLRIGREDYSSSDYTDEDFVNQSLPAMYLQSHTVGSRHGDPHRASTPLDSVSNASPRLHNGSSRNVEEMIRSGSVTPRSVDGASPRVGSSTPRSLNGFSSVSPRINNGTSQNHEEIIQSGNGTPRSIKSPRVDSNASPRPHNGTSQNHEEISQSGYGTPRSVKSPRVESAENGSDERTVDDMFGDAKDDSTSNGGNIIATADAGEVKSAPVRSGVIKPLIQSSTEAAVHSKPKPSTSSTNGHVNKMSDPTSNKKTPRSKDKNNNYVKLELDCHVADYMRKVQHRKLREIEAKHQVRISIKKSKEISDVYLAPMDSENADASKLDKAKEELINTYQTIFYAVVKEIVTFDPNKIAKDVYDAVVLAVKRAFSRTVIFQDEVSRGKIILVGEWSHVSVAVDWIKEKLNLKLPSDHKPQMSLKKTKGFSSQETKPKMMLVMDPYSASQEDAKALVKQKKEHLSREKQRRQQDERLTKSMPSQLHASDDDDEEVSRLIHTQPIQVNNFISPSEKHSKQHVSVDDFLSPRSDHGLESTQQDKKISTTTLAEVHSAVRQPSLHSPEPEDITHALLVEAREYLTDRGITPNQSDRDEPGMSVQSADLEDFLGLSTSMKRDDHRSLTHSSPRESITDVIRSGSMPMTESFPQPSTSGTQRHHIHDNNWWEVMEFVAQSSLKVCVCNGDITRAKVDCVASAANERLHNIGGVARAIADAAGPEFQEACLAHVTKYGYLKVGEVISLHVDNSTVSWQHVLLALGPMWCLYPDKDKCAQILRDTFTNILKYADQVLQIETLAVPAISTGIFGVPLDVCARALYDAIQAYTPISNLTELLVVNLAEETSNIISAIFMQLQEAAHESGGYESDTSSFFQDVVKANDKPAEDQEKQNVAQSLAVVGTDEWDEQDRQDFEAVLQAAREVVTDTTPLATRSDGVSVSQFKSNRSHDYGSFHDSDDEEVEAIKPTQQTSAFSALKLARDGLESDESDEEASPIIKRSDVTVTHAVQKKTKTGVTQGLEDVFEENERERKGIGIESLHGSTHGSDVGSPRQRTDRSKAGSEIGSPRGSIGEPRNSSVLGSPRGSIAGSKHGSAVGSPHGSITGSNHGSTVGSLRGSIAGSKHGSAVDSPRRSITGSKHGSTVGSPHGSVTGSKHGSEVGSPRGSIIESKHGLAVGSPHGSIAGSMNGSAVGSPCGSIVGSKHDSAIDSAHGKITGSVHSSAAGSPRNSITGSTHDSRQQSLEGCVRGSSQQSPEDSVRGSRQQSPKGSVRGSRQQSPEGSVRGSRQQSPEGSERGSRQQSPEGSLRASKQSPEGSLRGSRQQSPEGSVRGSRQQSPEGSVRGSRQQSPEGSVRGSRQQSPEGSVHGSSQQSPEGSVRGSRQQSPEGSVRGLKQKSPESSVHGSIQQFPENSLRGSRQQSPGGSMHGSRQQSPEGSVRGSRQQSPEGSEHGSIQQSPENSLRGSRQQSPGGSMHGSRQQSPEGSVRGSRQQSPGGSVRGSRQQSPEGSVRGSRQQSPRGSVRGSRHQSPEGSVHGSREQSPTARDNGRRQQSMEGNGSVVVSPRGSMHGSTVVSPRCSITGSIHGSSVGTPHGSIVGSEHGTPRGSIAGSKHGSAVESPRGSITGSKHGSAVGSPRGSITGLTHGSAVGSPRGSITQATHGSAVGSPRGSITGSKHGSAVGSPRGSITGLTHGSAVGSHRGSITGSKHGSAVGSPRGSITGSTHGSAVGSPRGSITGSKHGSAVGSPRGSITGSTHGSAVGSPRGSITGSKHGSAVGSPRGSITGSTHGSAVGSPRGSITGSKHGSVVGSPRGSITGSTHGSAVGITRGSITGSTHGSAVGSSRGSITGSAHGSAVASPRSVDNHTAQSPKTMQRKASDTLGFEDIFQDKNANNKK